MPRHAHAITCKGILGRTLYLVPRNERQADPVCWRVTSLGPGVGNDRIVHTVDQRRRSGSIPFLELRAHVEDGFIRVSLE